LDTAVCETVGLVRLFVEGMAGVSVVGEDVSREEVDESDRVGAIR